MATLTGDDRTRVRTYFDALLPRGSVDAAVAAVAERAATDSDLDVLVTAHDVLHQQGRVAPEVEVDVLVHDVGLSPQGTARIMGVEAADVHRALDTVASVAAELGLEGDIAQLDATDTTIAPPPRDEAQDAQPTTHAGAAATATPPDAAPRTVSVPEPPATAPTAPDTSRDPAVEATRGRRVVRIGDSATADASARPIQEPEAPSRRGPIFAIFAVFAVIAVLVVVASALA